MKNPLLTATLLLSAAAVFAADPSPDAQVKEAIAKLHAASNYSWTMNVKLPGMGFQPGTLKGRAENGGYAVISQDFNDQTMNAVFKGDKVAVKVDDAWLTPAEDDRAAMTAAFVVRPGAAADEAANLFKKIHDVKAGDDGALAGDMTDQGAKELLTFPGPPGGDAPPPPQGAKGSVKYWIKDGGLTKFESHLTGKVAFGQDGEPRDFDITRTVEIHDIGTTKLDAPADAIKKLEGGAKP